MFWFNGQAYATLWDSNKIGNGVVSVRFSTSERKQDGTFENSNWDGVAFRDTANIIQNLRRGDRFVINKAKIAVRSYEKDGQKFFPTSVTLIDIAPVSSERTSKNSARNTSSQKPRSKPVRQEPEEDDDEEMPW